MPEPCQARPASQRAMDCNSLRTIHTIGHSTRSIDDFVALLKAHAIELVVDVRRWPASRRFPHFRREALGKALAAVGMEYLWRGDLGGFRQTSPGAPHTALALRALP